VPRSIPWLQDRLDGKGPVIIIDGGMGTHLEQSGVPMDGKVWSGRAVLSHPNAVRRAHEAFIDAGAEVIIANTFAAARHMLEPGGLGDQVRKINIGAVKLAKQARDNVGCRPIAIAGSVCEWAPTDDPRWHSPKAVGQSAQEQVEFLVEAGVDLIALEMCQDSPFSQVVIEAALASDLPLWIGLSAKSHAGHGSLSVFDDAELDFEELVRDVAAYPAMMINIMHTPVPDITAALEMVKRHWNGALGVYPESGYFTMPNWQFVEVIEPDQLVSAARDWIKQDVRLLGGCCGLGPEHIAALRQAFNN